uniref:Up-frameshift suppressor 2 C-terminal domain-containing protein n=1 Tax=Rhizochromulina marina TaxID=1034831 RepID=A0A7S2WVD8_9STRA|mmetsp:Transcript_8386/g.23827  ORF Transcript_8386/g.23827 Transcript_8386/m.23827 type:complete len:311 (+) Transcript_8386:3-935(+)
MEEALAPAPDVQYPYAEDEDDEEEEEDGEGDNEDDEGSQDGEDHGSSKGEVEQGADEVAEEEYDEEEEADGEGAALADDENAVVHVAMREKTAEDDDFERALARMMQDTLETSRKSTSARAAAQRGAAALTSVPIGLVRRGQDQPGKDSGDASAASVEDKAPPGFLAGPAVKFQLLQKGKQGKVEAKSLFVPEDTNLAETVAKTRQEELKEKEAIKALVLNYGREVEEQEYWESERYGGRGKKTVVMGDVDGGRAYAKVPLQKIKQRSVPQPQKRASGDQGAAASASAAPRDRNARGRGLDFAGKLWEAD